MESNLFVEKIFHKFALSVLRELVSWSLWHFVCMSKTEV